MKDQNQQERTATARDEDNALLLQAEISDAMRKEIGYREEIASDFAGRIVKYLRQRLGAQQLYIPAPSKAERDAAIYREYNGTNAGEVCAQHKVSRSRMHEICSEQRALARQASPVSSLKTGQAAG